jgi:hypothetical protein
LASLITSDLNGIRTTQSASRFTTASPLFSSKQASQTNDNNNNNGPSNPFFRRIIKPLKQKILSYRSPLSVRRRWTQYFFLAFAAAFFWLGTATLHTQPTFASSATMAPIERIYEKTSPSLDKIIDRYVKKHMFDDDKFDPVESLYREAFDDVNSGTYPQALREIAGEALGKDVKVKVGLEKDDSFTFAAPLMTVVKALEKRGLSRTLAFAVLGVSFVLGAPSLSLLFGMIAGNISKRNIRNLMKTRYGDSYTLDATIKPEEVIEAPDDDEDEEEDDEDADEDAGGDE